MLIKFNCKKCKKSGYLDVGDLSKLEAMSEINKQFSKGFTCSVGNHTEVDSMYNYYDIEWDKPIEEEPICEEYFVENLKNDFDEVYTTTELRELYKVESFYGGNCLVSRKNNDEDMKVMLFFTSPQGKRYYVYGLKE